MDSDARILSAALLWARNHLEVGNPEMRDRVIERIDRVLKYREPTPADMQRLRDMYPEQQVKS